MSTPDNTLEARRWLRDTLRKLGAQHPDLNTPEKQTRLKIELQRQDEEDPTDGEER